MNPSAGAGMNQDDLEGALDRAIDHLRRGELVAFPTETVYGLGADASNPVAVSKIFQAKGRPADHPVIVHIPCDSHLEHWARDIPAIAWELAEAFWPGPLTLILKRQPHVSALITGGQETIGLRVPGHPVALELLRRFNGGVAAPSANRFGRISPTSADHVRQELGEGCDSLVAQIVDGGASQVGIESTIIDLTTGVMRLLRPGHIRPEDIEAVCGLRPLVPEERSCDVRASGMLEGHYAPRTPLRMEDESFFATDAIHRKSDASARDWATIRLFPYQGAIVPQDTRLERFLPDCPELYARKLYLTLRELDQLGVHGIVVQAPPETPEWRAVLDRLRRAAAGSGPAPK